MYQASLFGQDHLTRVVNVASVPQLSPFRYPGGKTWLVPRIRVWLAPVVREQVGLTPVRPVEFIEPFAGGGIISLTVATERLAEHVTMVELDADVAAVWQTALDADGGEWLAHRILDFKFAYASVVRLLAADPVSTAERAFQTIVKNRVCHGGILAPGSGLIKYGEDGRGIGSRWYPGTLARRIRHIAAIRERITFVSGNGLDAMAANVSRDDAVFFIDPPYTVAGNGKRAGKRLYRFADLDHALLFTLAAQVRGDFLMTYDAADEVTGLATQHGLENRLISMKNTHHAKMAELLISPNLGWATQPADIAATEMK